MDFLANTIWVEFLNSYSSELFGLGVLGFLWFTVVRPFITSFTLNNQMNNETAQLHHATAETTKSIALMMKEVAAEMRSASAESIAAAKIAHSTGELLHESTREIFGTVRPSAYQSHRPATGEPRARHSEGSSGDSEVAGCEGQPRAGEQSGNSKRRA